MQRLNKWEMHIDAVEVKSMEVPNMIDTHTHLDRKEFDGNRESLMKEIQDMGIEAIINPAIEFETNDTMRKKLEKYPFIFFATGIHPERVPIKCNEAMKEKITSQLKVWAKDKRNVAIGETGLDFHKPEFLNKEMIEEQKGWFERQIDLALELNLPLILHIRDVADKSKIYKLGIKYKGQNEDEYLTEDAHEIALEILKKKFSNNRRKYRGVIHCFNGDKQLAKEYIDLGFVLGIGGRITYNEDRELKETIAAVNLDDIVLETDAPFVSPVSQNGKINTPLNLRKIAKAIAEIKKIEVETVIEETNITSKIIFSQMEKILWYRIVWSKAKAEIEEYLPKLTKEKQEVLIYRFGIGDGVSHTVEETAREFGVAPSSIRQLERTILGHEWMHHRQRTRMKRFLDA